jgi:hypothetical protein
MNIKKAFSRVAVAATIGVGILGVLTGAQADFNTAASNAARAPETGTVQIVTPSHAVTTNDASHKPTEVKELFQTPPPTFWKWHHGVDANGNPTQWKTWVPG